MWSGIWPPSKPLIETPLAALLALLAAAGGLALARADAASDAHTALAGALLSREFVQLHVVHSLSLLSR
jgi:hypothetical protein